MNLIKSLFATFILCTATLCAQTPVIGIPSAFPGQNVTANSFTIPGAPTGSAIRADGNGYQLNEAQQSNWVVSPNCGGQPNCTKVFADTKYVTDATSTSTTTVTAPDGNFTQADVGKVVWATTQGTGVGVGYLIYTTFVCPQTTISAVNSSTSITLANTCTASGSGNVVLVWGHDDGPTLASLDSLYGCNVVHIATGNTFIMDSKPFFNTAPSGCNTALQTSTGAPMAALVGDGFGASQAVIVLTPNFSWSSCVTAGCIGTQARTIANLQLWGTGLTSASNSNCANGANKTVLAANGLSSTIYGVDLAGICPGETGMAGVSLANTDENFDLGGAQEVGVYACFATSASAINMRANDCHNTNVGASGYGLVLTGGAQVYSFSEYPIVRTFIQGNSTLITTATNFQGVTEITSGSTLLSYSDTFLNGVGQALLIDSGAFVRSAGSKIGPITNNGTFVSMGGNQLAGLILTGTGVWSGAGVDFGTCQGTLTSSSTLGFYGFGQLSSTTCTTTVTQGVPVQQVPTSGSVFGLVVKAGHAGVSSSSGVVTILKNGSPTSITCTIGTGTSCVDIAHFDIPAEGDVYSAQITTQGSEVLANVTASLLNF